MIPLIENIVQLHRDIHQFESSESPVGLDGSVRYQPGLILDSSVAYFLFADSVDDGSGRGFVPPESAVSELENPGSVG